MSTRMFSREALAHFENLIYLPMLITILTRDKEVIENSPIKLKRPYICKVDNALKHVQIDLRLSHEYLRRNNMRLEKGKVEGIFSDYLFINQGYKDLRRYLVYRLRYRSEELLAIYLDKRPV